MMNSITIERHRIAYIDQGAGEVLLIVHGTPTNSKEYEVVIKELSDQYRCIAIDHLGFGSSEKPLDGDYSLKAHQTRLEGLIQQLGVTTFHLLVHDFGGVIGLPLMINPKYQIKSVTILNSWLWPLCETEPALLKQQWAVNAGLLSFLYRQFNFSPKFLIKLAWGTESPLAPERHQMYIDQFPTPKDREGTVGFMKALFDFKNPIWQQAAVVGALKTKPVQIIWGLADKLVSPKNLARWKQEIPNVQVHELEKVGHFVAEEAGLNVAIKMKNWLGMHS